MTHNKAQLQLLIVLILVIAWLGSLILATVDGAVAAKVLTPIVTTAMGWLFTQKATEG